VPERRFDEGAKIVWQKLKLLIYSVFILYIAPHITSGGFRVGGDEARLKMGPSDDGIILSQP